MFPAPFPKRFESEPPNEPVGPFAPTLPPTTPSPFGFGMRPFGAYGPAPGPAPMAPFGFGGVTTTGLPRARPGRDARPTPERRHLRQAVPREFNAKLGDEGGDDDLCRAHLHPDGAQGAVVLADELD